MDKNLLLSDDGRFVPAKAAEAIPHGVGHVARLSDNWQLGAAGVELGGRTRPGSDREAYDGLYRRFREHYPALKPLLQA